MTAYLGIDTSCYTTSLAIANQEGEILRQLKIPLEVAQGKKGLQQSQAVFLHIKNFSRMFREYRLHDYGKLGGICVSERPRPQCGSYMPVFTVGTMLGDAFSSLSSAPVTYATHQEGHLSAALIGNPMPEQFLAAHVSGGTTEILSVQKSEASFLIDKIGGTKDIAAGQLIDRLGQKLAFPFPSGKSIEQAAANGEDLKLKVSVSGTEINLSGLEAQLFRIFDKSRAADLCSSVLLGIARTLELALESAISATGIRDVLLFGGVICNGLIRSYLSDRLERVRFAKIEFSSDNAAGLAVLAAQRR